MGDNQPNKRTKTGNGDGMADHYSLKIPTEGLGSASLAGQPHRDSTGKPPRPTPLSQGPSSLPGGIASLKQNSGRGNGGHTFAINK